LSFLKPAPAVLQALDNFGEVTGIILTNANQKIAAFLRSHH